MTAEIIRMNTFLKLAILVVCIVEDARVVVSASSTEGASASTPDGHAATDDQLIKSDLEQIESLQDQIVKLQSDVAEIVRSFVTLDLIVKNPSMMTKLDDLTAMGERKGIRNRVRSRRQVDSPQALPTVSGDSRPNLNPYRGYHGPYSYPMFSGYFLCPAGIPGPRGPPGPAGIPGRDGRDGRDAALTPRVELGSTGAIYIRWGNSQCREGSELVYAGTIGGALNIHSGGGANYLCLPSVPIYDEVDDPDLERAIVYTSEYRTSTASERLRSANENTPTCAVCRAPAGRTSKLMIPARNACPSDDWRLEYKGYLMADKYTQKRSEFICVDREMECEPGTQGNQTGTTLYLVEARCYQGVGHLCGPYVFGNELTCAVCTI